MAARRLSYVNRPPTSTPASRILAVEPELFCFNRQEIGAFEDHLNEIEKNSASHDINSVDQILMAGDGTLFDGYKPTSYALYQLTRYACPGLYKLLVELTQSGFEDNRLAAVGIYNQVIRLYYKHNFIGRRLLYNKKSKIIDAVVSADYASFSNVKLWTQTAATMSALQSKTKFLEATMCGRWLNLRFYTKGVLFKLPGTNERFFSGYYFSNHEGGLSALKGTNMLIRAEDKLCFIEQSRYKNSINHIGSNVQKKFDELLDTVTAFNFDVTDCQSGVINSMQTSLGLGLLNQEEEEKREYSLSRQMQRWKISYRLTEKVVANVLVQSYKDTTPTPLIKITREELQSRSLFDLALSLAREAKRSESIAAREDLERVAFLVLTGRLRVK